MDIRVIDYGSPDFDQTLDLRKRLLRDPLNLQFMPSDIEAEFDSVHIGGFDAHGAIMATLTMKPISAETVKMRQVAVLEKYQRRGIGQKLVAFSEKWSLAAGFRVIELHARETALSFYLNLKYEKVGRPFKEVGIKHYKMRKTLSPDR